MFNPTTTSTFYYKVTLSTKELTYSTFIPVSSKPRISKHNQVSHYSDVLNTMRSSALVVNGTPSSSNFTNASEKSRKKVSLSLA